jgi:hypothetical protein
MTTIASLEERSVLMDVLFAAAVGALFSGIHHEVGSVKVQLSDVLALMAVFLAAIKGFASPPVSRVTLIVLITYLLYYSISGMFVELSIGVTKIVQNVFIFAFLIALFGYYRTRSAELFLVLAAVMIIAVLAGNIGWHVLHGKLVGWKDLNEPKTIFTLLPIVLIVLLTRLGDRWKPPLPLLAGVAIAVIIFLSGERKAYIFAVLALAIWSGPVRIWKYALAAALVVPLFLVAAAADKTGYLQRQLSSFEQILPGGSARAASASKLLDASRTTTLSNAEREFSNRLAASMWTKQPVLGIGTGAFALAVRSDLSIPENFRMGIHGEFFRNLYEDGIVGLALYVSVWITALMVITLAWPATRAAGNQNLNKIKLLALLMLSIYVAFEASKGLTLVAICVLPFLVALPPGSLLPRRARMLRPAGPALTSGGYSAATW